MTKNKTKKLLFDLDNFYTEEYKNLSKLDKLVFERAKGIIYRKIAEVKTK